MSGKVTAVPAEEIRGNKYDLSINRYKETSYAEAKYESPEAIIRKLKDLEKEIENNLSALEGLL